MTTIPEEWRKVSGYEGKYEVSNLGEVRNSHTGKKYKLQTRHGYKVLNLTFNGKTHKMAAHRLVAMAFLDNPENKPQVNHIDGNHANNRVDNLEWCTAEENIRHAVNNHLYRKGMEYYQKHGRGQWTGKYGEGRGNESKRILRRAEILTEDNLNKFVSIAEKLGVTCNSLVGLLEDYVSCEMYFGSLAEVSRKINRLEELECAVRELRAENERLRKEKVDLKNAYVGIGGGLSELYPVGSRYGYLTVIGYAMIEAQSKLGMVCKCDCGNIRVIAPFALKHGVTKSCGCKSAEMARATNIENGNVANPIYSERLYKVWSSTKQRCKELGTSLCREWYDSYPTFYEWAYANGYNGDEHLFLQRKKQEEGYSPENCFWGDSIQHGLASKRPEIRKKYDVHGEMLDTQAISEKYNISEQLFHYRISKKGMTPSEAVSATVNSMRGRPRKDKSKTA